MLATHFFSSLEPADLDAISRRLMLEKANPNKVLMQAGDDADTFFIVLSGQLQVRSHPIWADDLGRSNPSARDYLIWAAPPNLGSAK